MAADWWINHQFAAICYRYNDLAIASIRFQIDLEKLSHIVQQSDGHVGVEGGLKKILFQIDMLSSETGFFTSHDIYQRQWAARRWCPWCLPCPCWPSCQYGQSVLRSWQMPRSLHQSHQYAACADGKSPAMLLIAIAPRIIMIPAIFLIRTASPK